MKNQLSLILCGLSLWGSAVLSAQESQYALAVEKQAVKKYTIMERFEPEFILTASERKIMKAERFAEIQMKMDILDTMDISKRRRERLMNDLIEDPFSVRLSKTWADTAFEEQQ